MSDLISRQDAIEAVGEWMQKEFGFLDINRAERLIDKIEALPSADAEPNWNCTANFVAEQLEKLKDMTDEERIKLLHILFPSAEAEPSLKAIKRQIDEHWYLDPPSDEAVQGEWVRKYDDKVNCYWYECDQCGEYRPRNQFGHEYNANFCPNCGAKMHKGGEDNNA